VTVHATYPPIKKEGKNPQPKGSVVNILTQRCSLRYRVALTGVNGENGTSFYINRYNVFYRRGSKLRKGVSHFHVYLTGNSLRNHLKGGRYRQGKDLQRAVR